MKTRLKKGDQVQVVAGKDKGKTSRVLKIDRVAGRVIVEGLNLVKKTQRPKSQKDKGGITEVEAFLSISNIMPICEKCGITRIGVKVENDAKVRICRKCGGTIG